MILYLFIYAFKCLFTCLSKILDILGRIDIGLLLQGSDLLPLLCMGNTLASLSLSENFPVAKLLFIRAAMLNDNRLATYFIILGPIPSNPIALLESKAILDADTCCGVILGILKYISFGTLSFTKFVRFVKSGSKLSRLSMPKISEIEEKYSFSLVATSSDDVYRSLFMIISSGKLLFELLSLLLILRNVAKWPLCLSIV